MVKYVLVADIGGTNSNFALVKVSDNKYEIIDRKNLQTENCRDFTGTVNDLLLSYSKEKVTVESAVFAVAGKIENGRSKLTNVDLEIDSENLIKNSNLNRVDLINDFEALAYSIENLDSSRMKIINKGEIVDKKPKVVIGAGTGLGHSILIFDEENGYISVKSEGGHGDFAAENDEEFELVKFIEKKFKKKYAEWEDVLSGRGIENIYEFISGKRKSAFEISKLKSTDENAKETFDLFYRFYARASKNLALEVLAEGGVYLAGGIVCKNLDFDKKEFMKEFTNNSNFNDFLRKIPVFVITDYDVSIDGLANYAFKHIN